MIRGKLDKDVIRELAGLLDETGLTEIEFQDGNRKFRVAKTSGTVAVAAPPVAAPVAAAPATATQAPAPAASEDWSSHPGAVTSPMVGTCYVAREPGAAPFVSQGDTVKKGQTIMVVEAMKTFNPIPAPKDGVVKKILVTDGKPVEFGEPLLVLE